MMSITTATSLTIAFLGGVVVGVVIKSEPFDEYSDSPVLEMIGRVS
jgi:hypothetical protein